MGGCFFSGLKPQTVYYREGGQPCAPLQGPGLLAWFCWTKTPPKRVWKQLEVRRRTHRLQCAKARDSMASKHGRGQKPALHPVAKRGIAMAANKRHQSTKKVAAV